MQGCRYLPQGDPWSPVALAAILQPAIEGGAQLEEGTRQVVYVDDRTIAGKSWEEVQRLMEWWEVFSHTTGIANNPAKAQFCGRTAAARRHLRRVWPNGAVDAGCVLGARLAGLPREHAGHKLEQSSGSRPG